MFRKDPKRLCKSDEKVLSTCPAWLEKALACPVCSVGCVRSPSGHMVCYKTPAHTGLVPKGGGKQAEGSRSLFSGCPVGPPRTRSVDQMVREAWESAPQAEKPRKPEAAVRLAWRVLRARFKKLVALFEDAQKS